MAQRCSSYTRMLINSSFIHPYQFLTSFAIPRPDGISDHHVTVEAEHRCVGIGTMSPEGTSEADYLWRAPPCFSFPRPKSSNVGEVGWGVPLFSDWSSPQSGQQILMGEFRQECVNRYAHKYMNPWYPGPNDVTKLDSRLNTSEEILAKKQNQVPNA